MNRFKAFFKKNLRTGREGEPERHVGQSSSTEPTTAADVVNELAISEVPEVPRTPLGLGCNYCRCQLASASPKTDIAVVDIEKLKEEIRRKDALIKDYRDEIRGLKDWIYKMKPADSSSESEGDSSVSQVPPSDDRLGFNPKQVPDDSATTTCGTSTEPPRSRVVVCSTIRSSLDSEANISEPPFSPILEAEDCEPEGSTERPRRRVVVCSTIRSSVDSDAAISEPPFSPIHEPEDYESEYVEVSDDITIKDTDDTEYSETTIMEKKSQPQESLPEVEQSEVISVSSDSNEKLSEGEVENAKDILIIENNALKERILELERALEKSNLEKNSLEEKFKRFTEEQALKNFEIMRLNVLLDLEEGKVEELKKSQKGPKTVESPHSSPSDAEEGMSEVVQRLTDENQHLTKALSYMQKKLTAERKNTSQAMAKLNIEHEISQKLAEEQLKDLEQKIADMEKERDSVNKDLNLLKEKLKTTDEHLQNYKKENERFRIKHHEQYEEMKQMHQDLLVAVRVANDFKTECQQELEKSQMRVKELEKINASLMTESGAGITSPKKEKVTAKPLDLEKVPLKPKPLDLSKLPEVPKFPFKTPKSTSAANTPTTTAHPLSLKLSRPSLQCVNVKSIIETLEKANKQTKTDTGLASKPGSPQRETNPLPLREQPILCNRQTSQVISVLAPPPADENKETLHSLVEKTGGSKRNALLKWVQSRVQNYSNVEITNFSSSWSDGLAFCALLHTYIPNKIPYNSLTPNNKLHNFQVAFRAAESVGIPSILSLADMNENERPDWQKIMAYIKEIYSHFEGRDCL